MNKWTLRLIGLLILLVLGLVIFDGWFSPEIPPALQQEISLEVNGESQTITPAPLPPVSPPSRETAPPAEPAFTLESLSEDSSEPQPVLSNPGSDKNKARDAGTAAAKPVETTEAAPPAEKAKPRKGGAWIQAGAFSSKENADRLLAQLKKLGWPVDTELADVEGKSMHRVFVGPLSSNDVNTYLDILGKKGVSARQVTR